MERIRIMMASVPGMLGEILLHAIAQSADMASIATLTEGEDARSMAVRTRPHVVLMGGSPDRREEIVSALLSEIGDGCVVTLSGDGRTAVVHRVRALPLTLEGTSPEGLLEIVRLLVTV